VSVLLNTTASGASSLGFAAQQSFATSSRSQSAALGDLNGDGRLDLIVANFNSSTVSVLLNITAPGAAILNFAAKQDFPTGSVPVCLAVGDLNGDGKVDVFAGNNNSGTVSVLLHPFPVHAQLCPSTEFATGPNPASITLGDLNGDGGGIWPL
jgi:hypothetical protein